MDASNTMSTSEVDTGAEDATDSLADILSSSTADSSESSLTSLTSDVLLQQSSTEESDTLKSTCVSVSSTSSSNQETKTSNDRLLPDVSGKDWYLNPLFQGYWKHYAQTMAWCQTHRIVTQKMMKSAKNDQSRQFKKPYSNQSVPKRSKNKKSKNLRTSKQPMFKMPMAKHLGTGHPSKVPATSTEENTTCDDSHLSDADSEVYEMELNEEMVDFFAQTEKHRQERDEGKKGPDGKGESIVDIAQASKKVPTVEAPKERPGLRRTSEMTQLYGKGAAMIHGMETALQMTFDRNVDIKQPPCWPNMPLKIVFN